MKYITAEELGERCKHFRIIKGMSMRELADLAYTTPQNISKMEKKGIHNIETVNIISKALGINLFMDEIDNLGVSDRIIFECVCKKYDIAENEIKGTATKYQRERNIIIYLLRNYTELSISSIAKFLGITDYVSVLYSVKTLENEIETDSNLRKDVEYLVNELCRKENWKR